MAEKYLCVGGCADGEYRACGYNKMDVAILTDPLKSIDKNTLKIIPNQERDRYYLKYYGDGLHLWVEQHLSNVDVFKLLTQGYAERKVLKEKLDGKRNYPTLIKRKI